MTQEPLYQKQTEGDTARHANRALLVMLDTNVLTSSYLLQAPVGLALVDLLSRAKGCLLLPEVVEREIRSVLGERMIERVEKWASSIKLLEAIIGREVLTVPDAVELRAAIDRRLRELEPLIR
jgi:hypothetical protein